MNGKTALGLDKNVGSLLCYLPICLISLIYSIIVIASDKENRDVRFHAFQSLLLSVLYIVAIVVIQVIGAVAAGAGSTALAAIVSILALAVIVAFLGAMIFGMIKGYQGQQFKFPVVGDMAEKWANG